jgi:hypothetical protein
MVGAPRRNGFMPCPTLFAKPSAQPKPGLWQVAQLIQLEPDRRGSKNNTLPNSARAGVSTLSAGAGAVAGRKYGSAGTAAWVTVAALDALDIKPNAAQNTIVAVAVTELRKPDLFITMLQRSNQI